MSHSVWERRCLILIGCALLAACGGPPRLRRGADVVLPSSGSAAGFLASLAAACAVAREGLAPADSGKSAACTASRADTAFGAITDVAAPARRRP